ncbi:MAG: mannitol-1-phosphate 5-dehydrogenase [bacterium]
MKKAIIFGAGNIGRGFLGQLLFLSEYKVIFIDVDINLINSLNKEKKYCIEIVGENPEKIEITNIEAIFAQEKEKIIKEIVSSDIIVSAVGVGAIKYIIPTIASGLLERFKKQVITPLNIIICENLYNAKEFYKKSILEELKTKSISLLEITSYLEQNLGLVESVIGRMVPIMTKEEKEQNPLLIKVEKYCELPVNKEGFKGKIPQIIHLIPADNFQSYVDRKLYTHNCGHAICAYLGNYKGYTYIADAICDKWIYEKVLLVMKNETGKALIKKHNLDEKVHFEHVEDLIKRFGNKFLGDTIFRVARDPIRKLSFSDRLIGAANLCLSFNIIPDNLCFGIVLAFNYFNEDDICSQELKTLREKEGIEGIMEKICKIDLNSDLAKIIREKNQKYIK